MKLSKHEGRETTEVPVSMTSMIDLVFLLVTFFMLVSDMTRINLEPVILVRAAMAEEIEPPAGKRREIVVNVIIPQEHVDKQGVQGLPPYDPILRIGGKTYTPETLIAYLKQEAEIYKNEYSETNPYDGGLDSTIEVLIRADRYVRAECIHSIYTACSAARMYKVRIGAQIDSRGE